MTTIVEIYDYRVYGRGLIVNSYRFFPVDLESQVQNLQKKVYSTV